ncbi:fatty acid-binding protein, intestinal isoform X6 [Microcaecilia unicolor]|uniref:Fatty acid-binding protein, intestinal-like isoform X6 n=1 Tax=Microcaecilia unicolor TaxID=1415580 RepID=A0A6P7X8B8_9AMPH|nr:fatty acid-binding protein, intestinal-like isoform X6 [Microcaecilia unicolor]
MAFDGTWKLDRTENYDKFMEVMGVDGKLAAQDNLMTIKQNGKQFSVHESSVFNASDMVFRLEEIHEYSMLGIKLVVLGYIKYASRSSLLVSKARICDYHCNRIFG